MNDEARVVPEPTADEEARWGDDPDWVDLGAITDAIGEARAEVKRLEDERAGMYRILVDRGVPRAAVARKAGVSDMAVRFVLEPDLKKRTGKKAERTARASR